MSDKQPKQFTEDTEPAASDWFIMQRADDDEVVKVAASNLLPPAIVVVTKERNPYKFYAYRAAALTSSSSYTKVAHDSESFDTNSNFASGTYTVPVNGFYWIGAFAGNTAAGNTPAYSAIYKNGGRILLGSGVGSGATSGLYSNVSGIVQLTAGDTVEHYFIGGAGSTMAVGIDVCYFQGFMISAT